MGQSFSEAVQYNIFQDFYKHIVDMSLNPYLDMAGDRIVRAKASGFPGWCKESFKLLRRWIRPLNLCHDFAASFAEAELRTRIMLHSSQILF